MRRGGFAHSGRQRCCAARFLSEVVDVAKTQNWTHGSKAVIRRVKHAGLSASWFELPYTSSHQYLGRARGELAESTHFFMNFSVLCTLLESSRTQRLQGSVYTLMTGSFTTRKIVITHYIRTICTRVLNRATGGLSGKWQTGPSFWTG